MRYTVQYIPIGKIVAGGDVPVTKRLRRLRQTAVDCLHLLIVRKSRKAGGYVVVSGHRHLDYLKRHTKKKAAPCLVDENRASSAIVTFLERIRKPELPCEVPYLKRERVAVNSWSIIRTYLKQDSRFRQLSRRQQLKVLRLALQYKKTTVQSMKAKVDEWVGKK
ncbi:hypothetical protein GE107_09370 [Cohnella sp. CFH 77786]|uniref:hypothetical protein n=1 Tax=Cohnella sp. CFH 77786 TaxID=2662265 RepID=UPI001C60EF3E|nr:hypothetical protein [Cohnella sp. CFH 77786]MBW5446267.1 hypothetical protein [Cohnella sp. CFH 77786]